MKTEKKYLIYGISLILLTLVGVSLAYFVTEIVGDKKSVSVSTGDLRIVFTDTDGSITGNDIEPGWNTTKTFSVENKTNSEYKYNIVIEDLINTFSSIGYLVYKITSDNGYNMSEYIDVPKSSSASDKVLAYSVTIPSKTTHNYTIEIKYLNDEENNQNIDMNSTLSGNIYIGKGTVPPTLAEAILRDNPIVSERTDFSVTNTSNTTGTIYKTNKTEDDSEVYYYSGNTTNNWVKFGKIDSGVCIYEDKIVYSNKDTYANEESCISENICCYNTSDGKCMTIGNNPKESCTVVTGSEFIDNGNAMWVSNIKDIYWRIIRTNEDNSIRLLYAGTSPNTSIGYIGTSTFNDDFSDDESRYVGYMYGENTSLEDNRTNTTSSTIKIYLENWYKTNLLPVYNNYISKSAIYCNDRSISSGTWSNNGSNSFYFGAYTRLVTNKMPSYKCGANISEGLFETTQAIQDKFSASTTGGGNGELTYPIALMTADEVAFAGGVKGSSLLSPYTYYYTNSVGESITDGEDWWLLSSSNWSNYSTLFQVSGTNGRIGFNFADWNENVVRPVLSISNCAQVTGTGTPEDPYVIDEMNSTC